jgi:hypothetical protein
MQYKYVFFGNDTDSEKRAVSFVDDNWDRVVSAGHSTSMDNMEPFEKPGWYVRLAKTSVAPMTIKAAAKKTT